MIRILLPILTLPFLCGFTLEGTAESFISAQPADEREAQDKLPMAKGVVWDTLLKTIVSFNEESGEYSANFPEDVKKFEGQILRVSGFILPLESTDKFTHFLLTKRTPTCAFCPPGGPSEIIEVYTKDPIEWDDGLVQVEGKFGFTNNQNLGVFFQINDAKVQ
ncbi:MAG: DUF3299 domain-containing protein [Pseudobdellovibrionaceae bacterium]|jgi:hypothetical protein|nr:DUF3299 domain-containing protein [Pseudobdellovibrionaceae bacterium]